MATIIASMVDNNIFGFNKCNFGIRSGFKRKAQHFSNCVKWSTFGKFQFNKLRVEKAFCMTNTFSEGIPSYMGNPRITYAVATVCLQDL